IVRSTGVDGRRRARHRPGLGWPRLGRLTHGERHQPRARPRYAGSLMRMARLTALVVGVSLVVLVAGCGGGPDSGAGTEHQISLHAPHKPTASESDVVKNVLRKRMGLLGVPDADVSLHGNDISVSWRGDALPQQYLDVIAASGRLGFNPVISVSAP